MDENVAIVQTPKRRGRIVKASSGGNIEKALTVMGGLAIAYTYAATVPLLAACGVGVIVLSFIKEIDNFQSPARAAALKEILEAKTVKHPSINEARKELKKYPADAVNQAIEEMLDHCMWVHFHPSDSHPLAHYGEVYCYKDPYDQQVMTPLEGIYKKLKAWGLNTIPQGSIDVSAKQVSDTKPPALPSPDVLPVSYKPASIGVNTQLGAIPVLPVYDAVEPTASKPAQFVSELEFDKEPQGDLYNPAIDLASDPYSALIVGVPGSGKGVFVGNAVRELKRRYPHIKVIGVDPKAKPEEKGLWTEGFDVVYSRSILYDDPDTVAGWILRIVRSVQSTEGATLLVVDELTALQSKLKNVQDKELKGVSTLFEDYLTSLASLGNGSQKYVWGVGQAAQGYSLPFDPSIRNQMRTIALVSSENVAAVQGLLRTDLIPQPAKEMSLVLNAIALSPVSPNKVAVFDGKYAQWFPMPVLVNYGEDRKAGHSKAVEAPIQPEAKPASTAKKKLPPMPAKLEKTIATALQKQGSISSDELQPLCDELWDGVDAKEILRAVKRSFPKQCELVPVGEALALFKVKAESKQKASA